MTVPSTRVLLLSFTLLLSAACDRMTTPLQGNPSDLALGQDLAGADLTSSPPPCLAAKGIAGTLLTEKQSGNAFCVDFDQSGLTDGTLTTAGWTLAAAQVGCGGFTVAGGRLTIKETMAASPSRCEAQMPTLVVGKGTQKIYVSIVHDLSLAELTQFAGVNFNAADTHMAGWTGKSTKAPPSGILQFTSDGPFFAGFLRAQNLSTNAGSQLPVWSIQSIAVFGAP